MKELPLGYTPLSKSNLAENMRLGPIEFVVKKSSHLKSKKLLEESDVNNQTKIISPYLFPSEMWGWARVFSAYFGRLNEVAVSKARWDIFKPVHPEEKLISNSKVLGTKLRNGLPFALAETTTRNSNDKIIIKCLDELLLLHDIDFGFYKEKDKEYKIPEENSYERERKVYFRHNWGNRKWINNIHTDEYAQKFGYKKGLPEFIMYMDWVFLSQLESFGGFAYKNTSIDLKKVLPIYEGEKIKIFGRRNGDKYQTQFFIGKKERVKAVIHKKL